MTIDRPAPEQIPQLRQLWKQAFGDDDAFLDSFFSTGFSCDRCRCITEKATVAAALYWFSAFCGDTPLAYLYAVATAPAFRGRGLCHKLMENTHSHLAGLGYGGTVLVPGSKELFALYEGMGYAAFGSIREFDCPAGTEGIPLRKLSLEEYTLLRRKYLPKGGILQEGETLAFLQTQADFYAGEGLIFAAAKNGDTLIVPELLGDATCAPEITAQLNAAKGHFRTPGAGRPFAMFHSLSEATATPIYFGIALD